MVVTDTTPVPASLSNYIHVRQSSIRSIHVVQDLQNALIIEEYLMTAQSRSGLHRILDRLYGASPTRAWTLTGPYGTGKSYFSLILMNLFCAAQTGHKRAVDLLRSIDPILTDQIIDRLELSSGLGLFSVPVAGSRHALPDCLRVSLQQALLPYCEQPAFQNLLRDLETWNSQTGSREIVTWLNALKDAFSSARLPFQGVLFILDEMGKLLEFAATNPEKTDVFLFQELAERANRSGDFPIVFIGILHQAFERYASLLNSASQREWAKVQGRFEDIAFQEPPSLQMRLLVRAMEAMKLDQYTSLAPILEENAEEAWWSGWQPALLSKEQFHELCLSAYPFHPSALIALPYVFKRLAQNERSLFAYLASSEPFGFQDFLQKHEAPEFLRLPHLFDYLAANFQARLYASGRARQLTETLERLSSAPNLEPLEIDILKTIGLINWLAEGGAVQATEPVVISSLRGEGRTEADLQYALKRLKERSLLVFRRYNSTYNIWQGSDVDIEERLDTAHHQLSGNFSFAETIQRYLSPRPLVARRHSYETGTLRYFEVRYVDVTTFQAASLKTKPGASGVVLLALPSNQAEVGMFREWASSALVSEQQNVVIGVAGRSIRLADLAQELRALNWVSENTPELSADPVARRELRARIAGVESLINAELDANLKLHRLSDAKSCEWYWQGKQITAVERNGLSHILSNLCDQIYALSPRLWNELVNRRTLSSQAAAARRNLIEAMLTKAQVETMGIEGFPPERSMYESLLKKSGLHVLHGGEWRLGDLPETDPLHLQPVWDAISSYIFASPVEPRLVSDLFAHLEASPFGLTSGVLPVFLCAFLTAHNAETTLYREGSLLPEPGVADWEVLLRRPELFSVAGCRVEGPLKVILERLSYGLRTAPAVMPVVRTLVRRLKALPEHAWRTQRLSAEALSVRHLVETAHSPERLLFHDLPLALHLEAFDEVMPNEATVGQFFEQLNTALEALSNATPKLQSWARDTLLSNCGLSIGEVGWNQFRELSAELGPRINAPALIPLLKRASEGQNAQLALESALAFVANRPLRAWSDMDADRFSTQAKGLGELFQNERRNYLPSSTLSQDQQRRCQAIAANVRNVLAVEIGDEPQLLRAALQMLARELTMTEKPPTKENEETL